MRTFRAVRLAVLFAAFAGVLLAAAPASLRAQDGDDLGDDPALEGEERGYEIWSLSRHDVDLKPEVRRAKMRRIAAHIFYDSIMAREDRVSLARRELEDPYWPEVLREELLAELDRLEAVMLDDPTKLRELARQELDAIREDLDASASIERLYAAVSLYGILDIMEDHEAQHEWVTFRFWLSNRVDTVGPEGPRDSLWRLAAEKDYLPAIVDLARRYRKGDGFPRDPAKAHFWYLRASGRGIKVQRYLDDLEEELDGEDFRNFRQWRNSNTGVPPP